MKYGILISTVLIGSQIVNAQSLKERFKPNQLTIQYAGSIGFISAGAGAQLTSKTLLSLHYGFVPGFAGGLLHISALKYSYNPVNLKFRNFIWKPLNPTIFLSYHFGKEFHLLWPKDTYPKNYYWWPSALRIHPAISSELLYLNKNKKPRTSAYIEVNTNELYITSYYSNRRSLKLYEIIKLGAGVRMYLK